MGLISATGMTLGQPAGFWQTGLNASTKVPFGPATVATPGAEVATNGVRPLPAGPTQLRVVVAGGYVHRLNGFKRRHDDLQQAGALVIVNALDLIVVAHPQLAVDFGLQGTAGVKELRMLESGSRGAGHDIQQIL